MMSKRFTRLWLFFLFMALFSATYQLGSMSTITMNDAQLFMDEFEELTADIDAMGIFFHNTTLALVMFVPGFGIGWGLFSAWSTGLAFAAIATTMPEAAIPEPLAILYLTPFGILELVAYSLATSSSLVLFLALVRRQNLHLTLRNTGIEIAVVVGLLLAGGLVEYQFIESLQNTQMPEL